MTAGGDTQRDGNQSAFTLTEIIVVIGLIAVLLAILLPCLGRARQAAKQIQCAANIRAWSFAVLQYAQDSHGFLPRRGQGWDVVMTIDRSPDWFNALPLYIGQAPYNQLVRAGEMPAPGRFSVWVCPDAIRGPGKYAFSYGMNMWLSPWFGPLPDKIGRVGPPASMVFMTDSPDSHGSVLPGPAGKMYNPEPRHGGRVNLAFLDGHVASYTGEQIGCGKGLIDDPDVRWKVPNSPWPGPP